MRSRGDEHTTRVLRLVYVCRPYEDALEFVSRKCRIGRATDERQLSVSARALPHGGRTFPVMWPQGNRGSDRIGHAIGGEIGTDRVIVKTVRIDEHSPRGKSV
jgi:hypothetical protein